MSFTQTGSFDIKRSNEKTISHILRTSETSSDFIQQIAVHVNQMRERGVDVKWYITGRGTLEMYLGIDAQNVYTPTFMIWNRQLMDDLLRTYDTANPIHEIARAIKQAKDVVVSSEFFIQPKDPLTAYEEAMKSIS